MLVTGVYKKHFVAVLIHNCPELGTDAGRGTLPGLSNEPDDRGPVALLRGSAHR